MPFDAKPPHFWSAAEGFVPDCVRHKAKRLWHSFFEFAQIYIYIYIYIYSLKESEDGQLLTIKKLKNLIKNKNVSVLDLHQLHEKLNLSNLPK